MQCYRSFFRPKADTVAELWPEAEALKGNPGKTSLPLKLHVWATKQDKGGKDSKDEAKQGKESKQGKQGKGKTARKAATDAAGAAAATGGDAAPAGATGGSEPERNGEGPGGGRGTGGSEGGEGGGCGGEAEQDGRGSGGGAQDPRPVLKVFDLKLHAKSPTSAVWWVNAPMALYDAVGIDISGGPGTARLHRDAHGRLFMEAWRGERGRGGPRPAADLDPQDPSLPSSSMCRYRFYVAYPLADLVARVWPEVVAAWRQEEGSREWPVTLHVSASAAALAAGTPVAPGGGTSDGEQQQGLVPLPAGLRRTQMEWHLTGLARVASVLGLSNPDWLVLRRLEDGRVVAERSGAGGTPEQAEGGAAASGDQQQRQEAPGCSGQDLAEGQEVQVNGETSVVGLSGGADAPGQVTAGAEDGMRTPKRRRVGPAAGEEAAGGAAAGSPLAGGRLANAAPNPSVTAHEPNTDAGTSSGGGAAADAGAGAGTSDNASKAPSFTGRFRKGALFPRSGAVQVLCPELWEAAQRGAKRQPVVACCRVAQPVLPGSGLLPHGHPGEQQLHQHHGQPQEQQQRQQQGTVGLEVEHALCLTFRGGQGDNGFYLTGASAMLQQMGLQDGAEVRLTRLGPGRLRVEPLPEGEQQQQQQKPRTKTKPKPKRTTEPTPHQGPVDAAGFSVLASPISAAATLPPTQAGDAGVPAAGRHYTEFNCRNDNGRISIMTAAVRSLWPSVWLEREQAALPGQATLAAGGGSGAYTTNTVVSVYVRSALGVAGAGAAAAAAAGPSGVPGGNTQGQLRCYDLPLCCRGAKGVWSLNRATELTRALRMAHGDRGCLCLDGQGRVVLERCAEELQLPEQRQQPPQLQPKQQQQQQQQQQHQHQHQQHQHQQQQQPAAGSAQAVDGLQQGAGRDQGGAGQAGREHLAGHNCGMNDGRLHVHHRAVWELWPDACREVAQGAEGGARLRAGITVELYAAPTSRDDPDDEELIGRARRGPDGEDAGGEEEEVLVRRKRRKVAKGAKAAGGTAGAAQTGGAYGDATEGEGPGVEGQGQGCDGLVKHELELMLRGSSTWFLRRATKLGRMVGMGPGDKGVLHRLPDDRVVLQGPAAQSSTASRGAGQGGDSKEGKQQQGQGVGQGQAAAEGTQAVAPPAFRSRVGHNCRYYKNTLRVGTKAARVLWPQHVQALEATPGPPGGKVVGPFEVVLEAQVDASPGQVAPYRQYSVGLYHRATMGWYLTPAGALASELGMRGGCLGVLTHVGPGRLAVARCGEQPERAWGQWQQQAKQQQPRVRKRKGAADGTGLEAGGSPRGAGRGRGRGRGTVRGGEAYSGGVGAEDEEESEVETDTEETEKGEEGEYSEAETETDTEGQEESGSGSESASGSPGQGWGEEASDVGGQGTSDWDGHGAADGLAMLASMAEAEEAASGDSRRRRQSSPCSTASAGAGDADERPGKRAKAKPKMDAASLFGATREAAASQAAAGGPGAREIGGRLGGGVAGAGSSAARLGGLGAVGGGVVKGRARAACERVEQGVGLVQGLWQETDVGCGGGSGADGEVEVEDKQCGTSGPL